jgi:predicted glycoside hydrolase/deacetylase ChbG (UPF0249 family)
MMQVYEKNKYNLLLKIFFKMATNRRKFIRNLGAGAASLGLYAIVPSVAAKAESYSKIIGTGKKLVVRADDVGFSKVCNIGTFEAIENGIVTSADVMLDSPGTEDALERLSKLPWISVGWHTHMWGAPVLGPREVPSLVEKGGQFDGRFRLDLGQAKDVVYDEAVRELRTQLDRCVRILGKAPDTGGGGFGDSPWAKAMKLVTDQFGLINGFSGQVGTDKAMSDNIVAAQKRGERWALAYGNFTGFPAGKADEKWASKKITSLDGFLGYKDIFTDSLTEVEENYDPVKYFLEDRAGILKYPDDTVLVSVWHPGYVDYFIYRLGERGNRDRARLFVLCRVQEVAALTDIRLKNWISENHIELVNYRDALFGTSEYQNHLKTVCSDLAMIS